MKTIVLYKSKYGSTENYAEWIADALDCEKAETGSIAVEVLIDYDCILIGGGIYASGLKGIKWLKKNFSQLRNKKIAVFAVGASPYNKENADTVAKANLQGEMSEIPFFYLRGKWDEANMTFVDRKMCGMLKKGIEKKPKAELEGWEEALLEASANGSDGCVDWSSKEQLHDLLTWAQHVDGACIEHC